MEQWSDTSAEKDPGYTPDFYDLYRDYLQEPVVRTNHDRVFEEFRRFTAGNLRVVDLGCGLSEYGTYGHFTDYAGVDVNNTGNVQKFVQADYHDLSFIHRLPFQPTAFTSLFSIECCHSADEKYALYEKLFTSIPSLRYALVSGFVYENRPHLEKVGEPGGITSYQTIEDPAEYISDTFSEFRMHMRTPSKMFGDDVIEVWKILSKR